MNLYRIHYFTMIKLKMQRTSKFTILEQKTYASAPKVPVKTIAAEFLAAKSACTRHKTSV